METERRARGCGSALGSRRHGRWLRDRSCDRSGLGAALAYALSAGSAGPQENLVTGSRRCVLSPSKRALRQAPS